MNKGDGATTKRASLLSKERCLCIQLNFKKLIL